jgi:hypothetical protein
LSDQRIVLSSKLLLNLIDGPLSSIDHGLGSVNLRRAIRRLRGIDDLLGCLVVAIGKVLNQSHASIEVDIDVTQTSTHSSDGQSLTQLLQETVRLELVQFTFLALRSKKLSVKAILR